ncbi:MAG: BatA domain-containing protein [archaeon]
MGPEFFITNKIGLFSFLSIIFLILLYLMKPKPIRKIMPSLIFLESGKKRKSIASFFRRFVKDYLFFIQLFIIGLLCLSAAGLATELYFTKFDRESIILIDASASSQAGGVFKDTIDIAKKNLGATSTIILIGNQAEILAKQTNVINALRILGTIKPRESLSNIWDAMMVASDISSAADVVVISDFIDTNGKDIAIAKKLLEAKGLKVNLISPRDGYLSNIGIISYSITGQDITIDVRNFADKPASFIVKRTGQNFEMAPHSIAQFSANLTDGLNKIEIETGDDLSVDDALYIMTPKSGDKKVLYISSSKKTNLISALSSNKELDIKKASPPIINPDKETLYVLDDVDYGTILPGTMDEIRKAVFDGAVLIIAAQDNIDLGKLGDLLPIELIKQKKQDATILNVATGRIADINFGQSSMYFEARKKNDSIILAVANDKESSPVITYTGYGKGKVLFYGIFDQENSFRLSTQYPLFWIYAASLLSDRADYKELNLKIGDIIYSSEIKSPGGEKIKQYVSTDQTGIYKTADKEIAVNLLNAMESDINHGIDSDNGLASQAREIKVKQKVPLAPILTLIILLLGFLEIYLLKKRGEL